MSSVTTSTVLVRKSRRRAHKVKTGCITCKIRRVKCGEEKPYCIRCTSTGRKCDGYAQSTNNNQADTLTVKLASSPGKGVPTLHMLGDNVHYLEFYHYYTSPTISDNFDKDFWSRIALQIAQSEPCVRHALVALGYVHKTEAGSLKAARSGLMAPTQQKPFLVHYNKAVNSLVQRISESSYSPEIGLVCCVLFVCIEFLRGNYEMGFTHFNSGLRILQTLRKDRELLSATTSSRPSLIEESIKPLFSRSMANAIIYGLPTELILHDPLEIRERPFTSILEAQSCMHNIRNVAMLFMRTIGPKLATPATITEVEEDMPETHRAWYHAAHNSVTKEDVQHQNNILEAQQAWFRALEEFERRTPLSEEDAITMHTLKANYYFDRSFTVSAMYSAQTDFDQHIDEFKAGIYHCKTVLDSMENKPSNSPATKFTFEINIIPCLYLAACRCRCPVTRREALSLLERDIPREGLWDAQQHAAVARRIIEIEEQELDPITGWPVERTRIWSTIIHGEMNGNGRFAAYFAVGIWGEGRGVPPLPPGMKLSGCPNGRMWKEEFIL